MKRTQRIRPVPTAVFTILSVLAGSWAAHAQLPFDPVGARHMAMGASSAAIWNSPEAIYHNPASLVWQGLTVSGGLQPVKFTRGPKSWWFHFYNQESEYGIPVALIAQGWDYPTPNGETGHYVDLAMPLAFNLTPSTPGAGTVHFAFERHADGRWKFHLPLDLGFLARHPSGATLGIAVKGMTIGPKTLDAIRERVEYGVAWGAGAFSLSSTLVWYNGDEWEQAIEHYRFGGEIGSAQVRLMGGYIHEPDRWYGTGGIGLRSDADARYEFVYSVVYDHQRGRLLHFLQYGLRWL